MCHQLLHMGGQMLAAGAWLVIIVAGVMLLRGSFRGTNRSRDPVLRSLAVLNERYARGEIDRDEYLERKIYLDDKGW
jgi:putative membrane protein